MPSETPPKGGNRWEGTHTYKKPEATKKRARTVAQLREEAAAKSKASREETISRRRGSIGGLAQDAASRLGRTGLSAGTARRGSTGGTSAPVAGPVGPYGDERAGTSTVESDCEEIILTDDEGQDTGSMPGSNKKKRHASTAKPMEEESSGEGVDKDLKAFLIAMKDDINKSTNAAVDRIDKRIDENARQISELKQNMERRDVEISSKISTEVRQEVAKLGSMLKTKAPDADLSEGVRSRRDRAFNHCRRTLKIWPIKGESLEDDVRNFMANKLKFNQAKIDALGAIAVSPAPGRAAREKGEVLATFETREDRDVVKAGGVNLAGEKEVGMSIHVPGHLMDNLIALNGIGYNIKLKNAGVKRSVKFDDTKQDIYLDICINGTWKRITPMEAKSVMEKLPAGTSGAMGGSSLSLDELSNLVQGEPVAGLTAVVVPGEEEEEGETQ